MTYSHNNEYNFIDFLETRHTAVLYNGRFYKVDAFTENDTVRGQEELLADLAAIISDGDAKGMNPDWALKT